MEIIEEEIIKGIEGEGGGGGGGWDGEMMGIIFVLIFDFIIFIIGFSLFIFIRHQSLSYGEALLDTSKKRQSIWRRFVNRTFNRYSEHKREEDESWFGWIPATLHAPPSLILSECGRDGYLYLRYQKLLIVVVLIESVIVCPLLLFSNVASTYHNFADISFSSLLTSSVPPRSEWLWAHGGAMVFTTFLIGIAIYLTIRSIKKRTAKEIASARLFTVKISNLPKYINSDDDPQILYFFSEKFPNSLQQFYVCKRLEDLRKLEKDLDRTESKIFHFEMEKAVSGKKEILIFPSRFMREFSSLFTLLSFLPFSSFFGIEKKKEAIKHYEKKAERIRGEIKRRKEGEFASTGVAFATFRSVPSTSLFLSSFSPLPPLTSSPSINKYLKLKEWVVERAPQAADIEWENLHISKIGQIVRISLVNFIIFITLFFFTTPVAMIGGIKDFSSHFPFVAEIFGKFQATTFGNLFLTFLPSFLLLLLTFLLPHLLFFTTKFEGYHTRNERNSAGIYKVYTYQVIAILVLPSLAMSSLESLISLSPHQLFENFRNGRLFPNGVLFIKYVLQAALLANTIDLWRGPELILEFINKYRATSMKEFKEAEEVPPFVFGFEYQYFMVVFTISLFYSAVLPFILPCCLLYLSLKHFVDKYNLLYHYPKTPDSSNTLSQSVITITLVGVGAYQLLMGVYFYFYKEVTWQALSSLACALSSFSAFLYTSFYYFPHWNSLVDFEGVDAIDASIFKDEYQHPCMKERERERARAKRAYQTFEDFSSPSLYSPSLYSPSPSLPFDHFSPPLSSSKPRPLLDYSSYDDVYDASD